MEDYDLVIVGAGWFGLAAAKSYLQLHPDDKIAVLESAESCGGTWSKNRLYPGLKSNNIIGSYEYPDFPMSEEKYGVKPFKHIPAAVLHQYLTDYAKHFGIFERTQFNTRVEVVEPGPDGGWKMSVVAAEGERTLAAARLILATGLTSTPNMPKYQGEEDFGAPLFHAKEFCAKADTLKDIKNAVVVGGAKSAFDVAYAIVEDGATVDLVIREDGHGPVWIAPSFVTPFKKRLDQLLVIRWMTWFSPCPWGPEDGYPGIRGFLHGTAIGRAVVNFFWKMLTSDVVDANGYDKEPKLKPLKPWNSAFWIGSGLSILNYDSDLFDLVKQDKIRVHIATIDHLEHKKVVLNNGTKLDADAVICSTGWKKESTVKFKGLSPAGFGLPFSDKEKVALSNKADEDVLTMFPRLRDQPQLRFTPKATDPLRLYRFIVPYEYMSKRTLAFAGAISSVSTSMCAAAQGLWISAYFDNKLDRIERTKQGITNEIMLHTQWGKWRFPCGYGANLPDFVFEGLPYVDMLLNDMGLPTHRKKNLLAEWAYPYTPEDYSGIVQEWEALQEAKRKV